ncbi:MAG TPA: hypothetical protein PKW92_08830 [Smithella sp.]|jgi:hypothetical protein|nr:hypothetical protein [Smithella sp.]NMC97280.1 hypothetical protein [Deltaproteobacteria bacterium]HOG11127.1 hypothetical protein [Smithella sp.]HOO36431.1 hypothetical protein [Smithella sp.]HPL48044.1 hypothetical protein [Smithella sp.]
MRSFPFIHILVLIISGFVLFILKKKYRQISTSELIMIFILVFALVAIFTDTGIDLIKSLIAVIQVD